MKKILLVDDERTILLGVSYALRADGVEVVTCDDAGRARTLLEEEPFDLVIADIRMSGDGSMDGLELLSWVKERAATCDVIIMSGYADQEIEREAYGRGACRFFRKPVDIRELLSEIAARGFPVRNYGD